MPFRKLCCGPQHADWGHGDPGVKQMFNATYAEESFVVQGNGVLLDTKNGKGRSVHSAGKEFGLKKDAKHSS